MKKLIFTAMSKRNFFQKWRIVKFVIEKNVVPLNAFMLYDYFLADSVDHGLVYNCNSAIIERCDELWVFGEISNGVKNEIKLANKLKIPIKYFDISKLPKNIKETSESKVVFERI